MTQSTQNRMIPVVTDVVVPGDPEIIRQAKAKKTLVGLPSVDNAALNFQQRIEDVESAIGQTEVLSPSRAHAIRAEKSSAAL